MKTLRTAALYACTALPIVAWHAHVAAEPSGRTTTASQNGPPGNGDGRARSAKDERQRRKPPPWHVDGLYNRGARRLLLLDDGRSILFEPVTGASNRFVDATGDWQLHGARGRYRVSKVGGRQAKFVASGLQRVNDAPSAPKRQGDLQECPLDCDTTTDAPDAGFTDGHGIPGAMRLDLRPASCRSYFTDYPPIDRGSHIEAALTRRTAFAGAVPTVRSFPLVDWIGDTELIVLHSRDLASRYLDDARDPDALFDRLLADGEAIQRDIVDRLAAEGEIVVRESGAETHLAPDPARRPVLAMVVRHGLASRSQLDQIRRAETELARRHGIELRVIEIP